uniref:Uncharacterized protein n=1 Tax=Arundo donax TaxID=35708 RepID=A0A0A8ZIA3_ARUDO
MTTRKAPTDNQLKATFHLAETRR